MPTRYRRIQVTEDPELARALRSVARHLPFGLPRSRLVRELAIEGARRLEEGEQPMTEERRRFLLERLLKRFENPETSGMDWDLDTKRIGWPIDRGQ
jgi:hypothetical protein